MSQSKNKIRTKPMRIAAIQYGQKPEDTMKVPEILEKGGFNVEQLLHAVGKWGYGLYDKKKHYDLIKAYIEESTLRGIDIILYANAHMIEPEEFKKHPEWAQRRSGNEAASVYSTNSIACVNSPWRDNFFQHIRDSLEQDIKGIFLDGPIFIAEGCHCCYCQKLFEEKYGHSLDSATRSELCSFKSEHIGRFVKDVRDVITQSGKDVILYANCLGLCENITGCDVNTVFPYIDIIGSEGGFLFYGKPNDVSIWHGTESTKYLESKSQGKPYVIFNAGNHQPWARHMHTAQETTLLYASVVSNGGNVWYGIHGPIDNLNTKAGQAAFRFNRFLEKNEKYFENTVQYSDTALLWSYNTVNSIPENVAKTDFIKAEENEQEGFPGPFQKEFHGISDMLLRCHRQFSIIDEVNIKNGDLKKFKTLIMPNTSCLDDKTMQLICQFVENGGHLIATMASGMCDTEGNKRKSMPLNKLFGIENIEEIVTCNEPGCGYITFEGERPFIENYSDTTIAGYSDNILRCSYKDDVETLLSAHFPMDGRYSGFKDEKFPSVIVNKYGKGTAAYISYGIGQTYADYGILDLKEIVDGLVNRFTDSDISVKNAFPSMEVEMRLQPGKPIRLIHFANHTGYMQRPIENFIECRNIEVSLKIDRPVKSIHSLFHPSDISFRQQNGKVDFSLDVTDYELVVVEM